MLQIHELAWELIKNNGFPVKHLSFSTMSQFLSNERMFLRKSILQIWEKTNKPVFMTGKSVHKALELYYDNYLKTGEILPIEAVQDLGCNYFLNRELKEIHAKALVDFIEKNGGSFSFPTFTKNLTDEEIGSLYDGAMIKAAEYVCTPPTEEDGTQMSPEREAEYIDQFLKNDVCPSLITLNAGVTYDQFLVDSLEEIKVCVENYFAGGDAIPKDMKVFANEREEKFFFDDEQGQQMPIPVKTIIDRVDADDKFCDITDYKTVGKFSSSEMEKLDYEMQAGANYMASLVATGRTPRKMRFVEILKSRPNFVLASDPTKKLLKEDLEALVIEKLGADKLIKKPLKGDLEAMVKARLGEDKLEKKESVETLVAKLNEAGIDPYEGVDTVDSMKKKLAEAGVLVQEAGVNIVEIDFAERPDVVYNFISLYKGIITRIAICELTGCYMPNPKDQWEGLESYQDFKEMDGMRNTRKDRGLPDLEFVRGQIVQETKETVTDDYDDVESL